jgi:hypothetical protein
MLSPEPKSEITGPESIPPVPGDDDDEVAGDKPAEKEPEEQDAGQAARAGNEVLEHSEDDANAYL